MAMRNASHNSSSETNFSQSKMGMNVHACCKARHRSLKGTAAKSNSDDGSGTITLPADPSSDDAASCCPLTSGSFVTVSRSQTDDNKGSTSNGMHLPAPGSTVQVPANRITALRLPGHEQTYLACCAFLI
jgi:hypothetical protein